MKKLKSFMSLLLAVVMVVGLLPVLTLDAKAATVEATQSNLHELLSTAGNGTVIVLTENAELVDGNYTIPTGATLLIPYASNKQNINKNNDSFPFANAESLVATSTVKYPGSPTYDQAAIKLTLKNTTLTVNGQLIVGGQYSSTTGPYSGQTAGAFGQIDMDSASSIAVSGSSAVLSCMGYITGGNIEVSSGAKVYEPFVVLEHNGGSYCAVAYKTAEIAPFSSYTLMNIQSTMVLNYGASLYGYCDLYASSQHNCSCALLIGSSNALFLLSNGSKATLSYSEENENGDSVQVSSRKVVGETRIQFDGNVTMGSLSMKLMSIVEVNTNTVFFPLPYNMELLQNSGTFTIPSDIEVKILPGAVFCVEQGAQLNVSGALVVFDGMNTIPYVSGYPYGSDLVSANQAERGKLLVNGTMTLADNSVFAGRVETTGTGVVSVGTNVTLNRSMTEGVDTSQTYWFFKTFKVDRTTKRTYHLKAELVDHSAKYSSGSKLIAMQTGQTYYGVSNEGLVTETGHNYTPYQGSSAVQNYHVPQTLQGSWSTSRVLYDDGTAVTTAAPVAPAGKIAKLYSDRDMTEEITQAPEQGVVYYEFVDCDHNGSTHDTYDVKEETHSFTCTICGGHSGEIAHSFGDTFVSNEAGHVYTCVCGKQYTESHSWGDYEKSNDNEHSRSCRTENCTATETADHVWSGYAITEDGTQHMRSCNVCQAEESGAHSWHNYQKLDDANHTASCEKCTATLTAAHDWNHQFATTLEGGHTYTCMCGDTKPETHTWEYSPVNDNTHKRKCSNENCGLLEENLPHNWGAWAFAESGTHVKECLDCHKTVSAAHSWEYTSIDEQNHKAVCADCSTELTEPHSWSENFESTESGHVHACVHCSQEKTVEHVWSTSYDKTDEGHVYECTNDACTETKLEEHEWAEDGVCSCGREAIHVSAAEDKVIIYPEEIDISDKIVIVACYQAAGDKAGKMVSCGIGGGQTYSIPLAGLEEGMIVRIFILNNQYAPVDACIEKIAEE